MTGEDSVTSTSTGAAVAELEPTQREAWQAFLSMSETVLAAVQVRLEGEAGMSLASFRVIDALAGAPGEALRMGALARLLGASTSRLAHAMRRLEENGWVRREVSPSDRRGQVAVLTAAGECALRSAAPVLADAVRRHLLAPLTAEQAAELARIGVAVSEAALVPTPRRSTR